MREGKGSRFLRVGPLIGLALLIGVASAQGSTSDPTEFFQLLRNDVGISDRDLSTSLATRRVLAVVLPTHGKGEVAVAGVECLRVPLEFFLKAFIAMPTLKRGHQVLQIHDFSSPPREQDLHPLELRPQDIQALSQCSPGDCGMKLSAEMMEQFRSQGLGHTSPDDYFKKAILEYVNRYLAAGNVAIITYDDKSPAVGGLHEFRALLHEADWLNQAAPQLYECLDSFSGFRCPQIDSFVYWSNALFGLKPVFSVTQALVERTEKGGLPWIFIAFKQIYADHYFDGSLGLAVLVDQSDDPAKPKLWVAYVNRTHTDALNGWLGPVKRAIAERRSRGAMQRTLLDLKASLERKYALSHERPGK
jgi:hypothetical protein